MALFNPKSSFTPDALWCHAVLHGGAARLVFRLVYVS